MKIIYSFIFIILISSCNNSTQNSTEIDSVKFDNIVGAGYLKLTASYDECGEWGGHYEEIKILRENKRLIAEYIKDSVDCKNLTNRKIIEKKKIILTDANKKSIALYLHSILNKSLEEQIPYHAGQWYSAETIDSSLIINYHEARNNWRGFNDLKKEILK